MNQLLAALVGGISLLCPTITPALAQPAPSRPCSVPAGADLQTAAAIKFDCSSTMALPDDVTLRQFEVQLDFPAALPAPTEMPWSKFDPRTEPKKYLSALLAYGIRDNEPVDWRIEDNANSAWCHAPWFQDGRERLRGMTSERGSRPFELHSLQSRRTNNWAVGVYNDIACHGLGRVWADPASPKTNGFAFADGSFAIKLLFTDARPSEVPYLTGSKEWEAAIGENGRPMPMRLLQVDVAARDPRPGLSSPWIFGTFIYDAYAPGDNPLDRLVPVGLTWGNDPDLNAREYEEFGKVVTESWVNPAVAEKFYHLPRHNLGLFGRLDGPIDNPKASCLGCHGQALDWGVGLAPNSPELRAAMCFTPFAPNPYDVKQVARYFRNLGGSSFVEGTQALDYSLQLSVGIRNFRRWVLAEYKAQAPSTTDVPAFDFTGGCEFVLAEPVLVREFSLPMSLNPEPATSDEPEVTVDVFER